MQPSGRDAEDGVAAGAAAGVEPEVDLGGHLVAQPVVLCVVAADQHLQWRTLSDARFPSTACSLPRSWACSTAAPLLMHRRQPEGLELLLWTLPSSVAAALLCWPACNVRRTSSTGEGSQGQRCRGVHALEAKRACMPLGVVKRRKAWRCSCPCRRRALAAFAAAFSASAASAFGFMYPMAMSSSCMTGPL